jgi:ribose transport system substrate-binding protein
MNKVRALPAVLAVASVLVAACSSASGTTSPTTAASAAGSTGSSNAGVEAAKAYLATQLTNPTSIQLATALTKKPDSGKLLVKLVTAQPVTKVVSDGTAAAAAALGWSYKAIPVGTGPEDIQKAFQAALQLSPTPVAIEVSGYPKVTFAAQLAAAKAKGVAVISESTTDAPGTGDGIDVLLDGPSQVQLWGKDIASAVIADSNGTAHVAMVSVSAYPILGEFVKGFKDAMTQWCPACTVTDLDQQATDVGTKTPTSIVSAFQRDPSLGYAVFSFGDLTIGLHAALTAAGLADKVKIAGETATAANIQGVKDGSELAWTGFAAPVLGWRTADAAARIANGDDLAEASNTPLPTQVITKDNVGSILTDTAGYYIGVADYADQFKKLWLVS